MVKKQTTSVLPHLPEGMAMPHIKVSDDNEPLMPGQKTLPDWRQQEENNQQLVPGTDPNIGIGGRRRVSIAKQGVPWTDRQSKVQMDSENEPPPLFSAAPNLTDMIRHPRESKSQKYVYHMESGIDPVILLSSRLESWRLAIKNLVALFKKIISVENKTSKGLITASKEIILPFRKSNGQFLESGGVQDVWSAIRDYIMQHGILHHETSGYIEGAVIPSLRAVKADIKMMLVQIEKDKGLKSNLIFESRLQVDRLITRLDKVIEQTQRAPQLADQNTDPFLINLGIIHAVRKLCDHENRLHDNLLNLQKETGIFEGKIIENVRYIISSYKEYRIRNKMESEDYIGKVLETFNAIKPNTEWNNFVRRNQYNLVMENSAYKTENLVEYPNQDSRFVRAIKIGPLQLKTGITKSWIEGVYLLTPAGFIHGYKTPKHFQTNPLCPSYSIFVPNSSIDQNTKDDTFEVRSNKDKRLGSSRYIFRAPTRSENQSWFEALLRIADQFRVIPLLDTVKNGFSAAPIHRDLPPLPASTLPLQDQPHRAIEAPLPPLNNNNNQQPLNAVHEVDEDGSATPKQQNAQLNNTITEDNQLANITASAHTTVQAGTSGHGTGLDATGATASHGESSTTTTGISNAQQNVAEAGGVTRTEDTYNNDVDDGSVDNWQSVDNDMERFETGSHHSKIAEHHGVDDEDDSHSMTMAQQQLHDAYAPVANHALQHKQGEVAL